MHILFVTEYLPPYISGIANRCQNLINGYRSKGHKVTVASVYGTDCNVVVASVQNPFYNQQRTFCLPPLHLLAHGPFDVCHIVAPLAFHTCLLIPFLKLSGCKVYVSYHVYLEYYYKHYVGSFGLELAVFFFALLYYIPLVALADCVGIPSKTADSYVFRYSRKVHLLKSGLDTMTFNPSALSHHNKTYPIKSVRNYFPADSTILIYVGRLAPEKDVEFLLNALAHPKLSTTSLLIVGDGPSYLSLTSMAADIVGPENVYLNGKSGPGTYRVVFTGMVSDQKQVASYYAQCDIFASASASETFGFTVAEAMSCGTPCVIIDSGAFSTVYKMISSWLFRPNDQLDFVNKVVSMDPNACGHVARDIAQANFGVDIAVNDFLETYESLLSKKRK
jgi:glycosyltransferase involved in cell wall biosynthesis